MGCYGMAELAILAAVGLVGCKLADSGYRSTAGAARPSPGPMSLAQISENEQALYDANFQASLNPQQTGIVPPNQAALFDCYSRQNTINQLRSPWAAGGMSCNPSGPFYRSAKTMASSDAWKQDRFETFTGQLDRCQSKTGTFTHKRESGPMFPVTQARAPVSFSGRQAYVDLRDGADEERYQVGHRHEGVGPTNPIHVGPGLGLDPSVPAAGAFHQFYRVCPENVNGYRKNSLPGRTIPGKALIPGGANIGAVSELTNPRPVWNLDNRPLERSRASATGPSQYGSMQPSHRIALEEGFAGPATGPGAPPAAVQQATHRGRTDNRFCGTILNPLGGSTVGGYNTTSHSDPGSFRQLLQPLPAGAPRGWNQGGFVSNRQEVGPTQREQVTRAGLPGATGMGAPTRLGGPPKPTGRDTLDQRHFTTGPASSRVAAGSVVYDAGVNRGKPDDTFGYVPGAATQNMYNPQVTTARLRQPANAARVERGGMASVDYARPGSQQRCYNKLPITAKLDLGLAKDVLNTNNLTHPIY